MNTKMRNSQEYNVSWLLRIFYFTIIKTIQA